jgi:hypothetical protein
MRQTSGDLSAKKNVSNDTDDDLFKPFINPFVDRDKKLKRDKMCFLGLYLLSTGITFALGYHVKSIWFTPTSVCDGSM